MKKQREYKKRQSLQKKKADSQSPDDDSDSDDKKSSDEGNSRPGSPERSSSSKRYVKSVVLRDSSRFSPALEIFLIANRLERPRLIFMITAPDSQE